MNRYHTNPNFISHPVLYSPFLSYKTNKTTSLPPLSKVPEYSQASLGSQDFFRHNRLYQDFKTNY